MSLLFIVIVGLGSLSVYFTMKIFFNKCKPDYPIEIQNHIQSIQDNDAPPKYEDIVNN
jgi:hypothetical protein